MVDGAICRNRRQLRRHQLHHPHLRHRYARQRLPLLHPTQAQPIQRVTGARNHNPPQPSGNPAKRVNERLQRPKLICRRQKSNLLRLLMANPPRLPECRQLLQAAHLRPAQDRQPLHRRHLRRRSRCDNRVLAQALRQAGDETKNGSCRRMLPC